MPGKSEIPRHGSFLSILSGTHMVFFMVVVVCFGVVVFVLFGVLFFYPLFLFYCFLTTNKDFDLVLFLYVSTDLYDLLWLGLTIIYQTSFVVLPVMYLVENDLPPASSVIITCEQVGCHPCHSVLINLSYLTLSLV